MTKRTQLHRILDDMRKLSLALLRERRFAARAGDVLLLVGVAIGDAECKPHDSAQAGRLRGACHGQR